MAKLLYVLSFVSCLSTALAGRVPRQVASTQYTNASVTTTPPTDPSASGTFCCQVYAPAAALNWWYTNTTIEAVHQTIVTEYLKYNNTIVPTATVTITNSSAADVTGSFNAGGGGHMVIPGIPTALNAPPALGQKYDQTYVLAETQVDFGYTTVAAPTPFIEFGYVFVFSGTVNNAGTCMGTGTDLSNSATTYDVSSAADSWFGIAAFEPIGYVSDYIQYTYFLLSTPYVSAVSTTPGEWYRDFKPTSLKDPFITYLAKDPVALSAAPRIRSCSAVSGAGAPGVHIQVSFLTTSSAVTSTTNALFVDKATTTPAVPANQPTPAGPISTPSVTIATTEATQTPPTQPSDQPSDPPSDKTSDQTGQASGQTSGQPSDQPSERPPNQPSAQLPTQPSPPPSTNLPQVSQEPVSPSQGQPDSQITSEISQNEPVEQPTLTSNESHQPTTQKTTADSPTVPIQSSGGVMSSGGQPESKPVQTTPSGNQASNSQESDPVDSQDASQVTSKIDTVQNTAIRTAPTGTSPVQTSQNAAPVAIGEITASPASSEGYIVGTQTLIPGSSAIEIAGTTYSLQASGGVAVVNGQNVQITTLAPPSESAIVLGDLTGRPAASGAYVVADQTLSRGGSAIEISGTTYSLAPSGENVVVNGEATPVSVIQMTPVQPATVVIGDVTAAPASSGAYYVVAGQTLSPEGSAIEVSGVTYYLPKSGANVVINGATSYANVASDPARVVLGSLTAASFMGGGYIVASDVLSPGGTAVEVSGTTYSLAASANTVFINGAPTAVQPTAFTGPTSLADAVNTPSPVVLGSVTATPFIAGGYILATQILSPGGTAVEVSGTTYSLAASANTVFINGSPTVVQPVAFSGPTSLDNVASTPLPVVFGSVTGTPFIAGGYILATQILSPGGTAVEVSGTTYSLATSGNTVFIDGKPTEYQGTAAASLTVGSRTFNAVAASVTPLVVASQTLVPGGSAITVSGTTYSLPLSGTDSIVVNGQTTSLTQISGIAVLSAGSQQLSFTPLNSGIVVASQTLYPDQAITVNGETLSLASSGSVVIVKSGESTTTEGLGDYIWQGVATSTTESSSESSRISGSKSSSSAVTTSRSTGTGTGSRSGTAGEGAAATTSASRAGRMEVEMMSWLSILTYLVLAVLVM